MGGDAEPPIAAEEIERAGLTQETINAFVEILRRQYDLTLRSASRHKERLTRTGFTLEEQVLTVDMALRMMGLTKNFARLVLFCAHGSTSDNKSLRIRARLRGLRRQ